MQALLKSEVEQRRRRTSASTLISSGVVKPCQTRGCSRACASPSTERAAASRNGPIVTRGNDADHRQASTSSSIGKRIQRGGSCGSRGRLAGGGPKNTPWMKRSE